MGHFAQCALMALFGVGASAQSAALVPIDPVWLPVFVDSNTASFWNQGQYHLFSSKGRPMLSVGMGIIGDYSSMVVTLMGVPEPSWIEAVHQEDDGTLLLWYHHETLNVCPGQSLTVPVIGAAVSYDGGRTLIDLGIVLESGDPPDCSAPNGYFAGGHGDFSVVFHPGDRYFYFYFTNYAGAPMDHGIAVARMAWEDRFTPVGSVYKFYRGSWNEPGRRGKATAIFPAAAPWHVTETDSFWGPSVHWNTHLGRFVMLLNRSCCEPGWPQEGIYLSISNDPSDPTVWSAPQKIIDGGEWYPYVLGLGPGETSALAGKSALLFTGNVAQWEIVFHLPGEMPEE
jgi:hypothetical protein